MKVFISWSGGHGKAVAEELHKFLGLLNCQFKPFVSSVDIEIGEEWRAALHKALNSAHMCVLCLTPEAWKSKWLLFEAGLLSGSPRCRKVCPYLIGVKQADVAGPLDLFQAKACTETGTRDLVNALRGIPPATTYEPWPQFEKNWPDLQSIIIAELVKMLKSPGKNLIDSQGLDDLLEIYLDAVAYRLVKVFTSRADVIKTDITKNKKVIEKKIESAQRELIEHLTDDFEEVVKVLTRKEIPISIVTAIRYVYEEVLKTRGKLKSFGNEIVSTTLPEFLHEKLPPSTLISCVLSGITSLATRGSESIVGLDDIDALIKITQTNLKTIIEGMRTQWAISAAIEDMLSSPDLDAVLKEEYIIPSKRALHHDVAANAIPIASQSLAGPQGRRRSRSHPRRQEPRRARPATPSP
jgi:hypothetical protein